VFFANKKRYSYLFLFLYNAAKKNQKSSQVMSDNERPVNASAVSNFDMYEEVNTATREKQQPDNYESLTHTDINNAKTDRLYQQLDSAPFQSQQPEHYEAQTYTNADANL
jgi:hypothetical protein